MKKDNKVVLTPEGYLELESELNDLKLNKRPEVINALKYARSLGDLSENADYDAARDEQAKVEARIQELEYMVEHATIVEKVEKGIVGLGSTVTIQYIEDDETDEYKIVGSLEADPLANKISDESPIGKALVGSKINDVVEIASPAGSYQVKIVAIA